MAARRPVRSGSAARSPAARRSAAPPRRRGRARPRVASWAACAAWVGLVAAAVLAAFGSSPARAQSIGYTVQVVAVSDREAALDLISELDGYPAYTVRATTGVGDVYRVRVGAFANRAAAERYAAALPSVGGTAPVPALAENIPTPLMPLQAALLGTAKPESEAWDVVAWGASVALRSGPADGAGIPTWIAVTAQGQVRFEAWRAAPDDAVEQTMLRVREVPLWPASHADLSDEARRAARASTVAQVARSLDLSEDDVNEAVRPDAEGVPVVVVLERVRIDAVERVGRYGLAEVVGLAEPSTAGATPERWIATRAEVPGPGATRLPLEPAALVARGAAPVLGEGWSGRSDGRFVRVETVGTDDAPSVSWRAVVGTPLWGAGDLLLVRDRDEVVLYRMHPR